MEQLLPETKRVVEGGEAEAEAEAEEEAEAEAMAATEDCEVNIEVDRKRFTSPGLSAISSRLSVSDCRATEQRKQLCGVV